MRSLASPRRIASALLVATIGLASGCSDTGPTSPAAESAVSVATGQSDFRYNKPPVGTIQSPGNGATFAAGTAVQFTGSATDPEDGTLGGASIVWRSSINGAIGTGTSFAKSDLSVGTHTITMTCTDSRGTSRSVKEQIIVTNAANQAPVAAITAPANNSNFVQGGAVSFTGTGTDPEDGSLNGPSLVWTSSRDGQIGTGAALTTSSLTAGTHAITLVATDSKGVTGSATLTITVASPTNQPPFGLISTPTYLATFAQAASVSFTGSASDPEDGVLSGASIVWRSSIDGQIGTGTSFTKSNLSVGQHTITMTSTDSQGATFNHNQLITVTSSVTQPAVASQMALVTPPAATAQSGVVLSTEPVAQLRDATNNVVAQAGVVVTASIASGGGSLSGTTSATTNASGVATFTDLAISGTTGARTLGFAAAGIASATSGSISVVAGAASKLTMKTQASASASSGVALTVQPSIQVMDAWNNAVAQSGIVVTAAIASGTGTLGGTVTATTNTSGVATFSGLSITGVGIYTLGFTAAGLTGITSGSVSIAAVVLPTQVAVTVQPSSSATSGIAFSQQPSVQLRDALNNAVSQSGVAVTAAIVSGGGTLGGTLTANTNTSGVATFTNLSITGTTGSRTLGFSASGLASATSGAISVAAAAPPPSGSEPVYAAATGVTLVLQDNMDRYSTATSIGAYPYQYSLPQFAPNPAPSQTSTPVDVTHVQVISPGRNGTGKAMRLAYDGIYQESHNLATVGVSPQPDNQVVYIQYYARVTPGSNWPLTQPLAVKWIEAWHVHSQNTRIQWNMRYPSTVNAGAPSPTVWQQLDQGEAPNNGDQPVGPYFAQVADGQWHRFTHAYKSHSSSTVKDGFVKMWLDGVLIVDVEQKTVGVTPPGGSAPWCSQATVDNLAIADGIAYLNFGGPQTTTTGSWTYDFDDLTWWRQ